jgi:hypothetical protein
MSKTMDTAVRPSNDSLGALDINPEEMLPSHLSVEGFDQVLFPAGTKRYVHVNPRAIADNLRVGRNYFPTINVRDPDGYRYEFHYVTLGVGAVVFDQDMSHVSMVHVVTVDKIVGFLDPNGRPYSRRRGCVEVVDGFVRLED